MEDGRWKMEDGRWKMERTTRAAADFSILYPLSSIFPSSNRH
jgi:hypothetical protein